MGIYKFEREQMINASLDDVWEFISSPANLAKITPPGMGFEITSGDLPKTMYEGMMVSYKVRPIAGIAMNWLTEITKVKEKEFFIDEQRKGPYRLWHHEHHLIQKEDGILMKDIITYIPPFGIVGDLSNSLFIRNKLKSIFDFRREVLEKQFN